jgi:hypothetical protein
MAAVERRFREVALDPASESILGGDWGRECREGQEAHCSRGVVDSA